MTPWIILTNANMAVCYLDNKGMNITPKQQCKPDKRRMLAQCTAFNMKRVNKGCPSLACSQTSFPTVVHILLPAYTLPLSMTRNIQYWRAVLNPSQPKALCTPLLQDLHWRKVSPRQRKKDMGGRTLMHFASHYLQYFFDKCFKRTNKHQLFVNILTVTSLSNQYNTNALCSIKQKLRVTN